MKVPQCRGVAVRCCAGVIKACCHYQVSNLLRQLCALTLFAHTQRHDALGWQLSALRLPRMMPFTPRITNESA
jgi:hypothetical protein